MVDFYSECEDGVTTLVLAQLKDLFPHPYSVCNDDTVLSKGGDHFLILRPGRFPYTMGSEMEEGIYDWAVLGDLYVRYVNYKTSWDKFKAARGALVNLTHMYPTLNDTPGVLRVVLASNEAPNYLKFDQASSQVNFIIQTLEFTVRQWVTFAGGEI
jgi:hypothetical protein